MASVEESDREAPLRGQGDRKAQGGTDSAPVLVSVATTDPDEATDGLRQNYAGADIRASRDDPAFEYRQDVHGDTEFSLGRFHLRGQARVRAELDDVVTVVRRRSGAHDWEVRGRRGTDLMLIQPQEPYRAVLELLTVDTVNFDLSALHRTALDVYGEKAGPLFFDHPRPAGRARETYWKATHDHVRQALRDPAVDSAPLLRADLLRRLAVATLESFPRGSGTEDPRRSSTAARAAACRRALAFMHDARGLPITLEDVAGHVGLSTVELNRAFRHHRGTTPGNVLRELRLEAAHEELLQEDPATGATVRSIARRWAFPDAGDFVRRYRTAYGVDPAATLRSPVRPLGR